MQDRIWVGTRKGLFDVRRRADGRWAVERGHLLGPGTTVVLPDPRDGTLYAGVGHGHFGPKMHRSRDNGETWQEIATPAFPPKPEGVTDIEPGQGREIKWSTQMIFALAAGGANEPRTIWCGTAPAALFRSADGGDTWELNRALWDHPARKEWVSGGLDIAGASIHSICVDPRDSRRISVALSCGGVWHTADGGQSWESRAKGMRASYMPPEQQFNPNVQDPHMMVQCPANPDHLWVQHHNGIFHSTDYARSWEEIKDVKPSTFGFAVAVHPKDSKTAWFVPADADMARMAHGKVVVTRTRDGGRSFEILGKGLPQEHAYDLTYRHALDVDATGNRLAFGSTSGNLWVSENGGDDWTQVSSNLPPVNAVRFART